MSRGSAVGRGYLEKNEREKKGEKEKRRGGAVGEKNSEPIMATNYSVRMGIR